MMADLPNALTALGAAGYYRGLFGKDHMLGEEDGEMLDADAVGVLYDEGEDICIGNMDDHPDYTRSWGSKPLETDSAWNLTERLTTAGIDFIARRSVEDKPFFLTLNYQDPHPFFSCPEPYASLFSPNQFDLPPNFRRESNPLELKRLNVWRNHSRSLEASESDFKRAMAMYCGQIRYVDDQVGRVLDVLEETNLLDDTIVIFWSDHGEFLGDFGVTHKLPAFYDSLVRVPMIVWDPTGQLPRGQYNSLVECMDVMASVLDIVRVPQPVGSRAYSLLSEDYQPREDVFSEGGLYLQPLDEPVNGLNLRAPHAPTQFGPGSMLRTREWKLCVYANDCGELFDVENDPHELNNLYYDPDHIHIRSELMERLLKRQLCQGQTPGHMPRPVPVKVAKDGLPVWDRDYSVAMR
jgi:arylsulfatase A-like enzyme